MEEDVRKIIEHIAKDGRSDIQKSHIQHGTTTVFDHSVNVAITSLRLSEKLNAAGIRVNRREGQEPFMAWLQTSGDSPQKCQKRF